MFQKEEGIRIFKYGKFPNKIRAAVKKEEYDHTVYTAYLPTDKKCKLFFKHLLSIGYLKITDRLVLDPRSRILVFIEKRRYFLGHFWD